MRRSCSKSNCSTSKRFIALSLRIVDGPPMSDAAITAPSVSLRRYGTIEASDVHDFHQVVLGLDGAMVMAVDGVAQQIDAGSPGSSRPVRGTITRSRREPAVGAGFAGCLAGRAGTSVRPRACRDGRCVAHAARAADRGSRRGWRSRRRSGQAAFPLGCRGASGRRVGGRHRHDRRRAGRGLDFARIDRWLRAHLSEPLRIADLAAHCGFGMRRFHQLFIDAFGETPHRYLQRLRLDTSITLLADPRLSLTDIALDIGFGDQSAYTHAFTRRFGLAPGQWRALRH